MEHYTFLASTTCLAVVRNQIRANRDLLSLRLPRTSPRLPHFTTPAQVSHRLGHAHPRAVNHRGRRVGRGEPPQSRQRGKDVFTEGKSKLHTNNTVDLLPLRGRLIQGLRWSGKAGGGCRRRNGRCRCVAGAALGATLRRCRRAGDGGRSG